MPSRNTTEYLEHILKSSEAIQSFIADLDLTAYQNDLKTRSAVERQLQILTEAAYRLGELANQFCPDVDWRGVRGLGNFLRHEYDDIDDEVIWQAIHTNLPHLQISVRKALTKLQGHSPEGPQ